MTPVASPRPTTTIVGTPISSASANFTPGEALRSSSRTRTPAASSSGGQSSALGGDLLGLAGDDHVDVERRDGPRPDQPGVVVALLGDRRDQARDADAVGAHRDPDRLAVGPERVQPEGVGVLAAELEDVPDLDAARRLEQAVAVRRRSPARTSAASMVPSGVKSRPTTRSTTWWSAWSAPVTHAVPVTIRGSTRNGRRSRQRSWADVALDQERVRGEVGVVEQRDLGGRTAASSRFMSTSRSPGTPTASSPSVGPGAAGLDQDVLQRVGGGERPAEPGTVEERDQRLDGRRVRRVVDLRRRQAVDRRAGGAGVVTASTLAA